MKARIVEALALVERLDEPYWQAIVRERAREIFHAEKCDPVVALHGWQLALTEVKAEIFRWSVVPVVRRCSMQGK